MIRIESGCARALPRTSWWIAFLSIVVAPALGHAQPRAEDTSTESVLANVVPGSVQVAASNPGAQRSAQPSASRSIGVTDRGRVVDSVRLVSSAHVRVRDDRDASYGTEELVRMIERAAARVAETHAGSRLVVGDLSRREGGRLSPHRSHRAGRDADIGFYLVDEHGQPAELPRFVNMRRSGCGRVQGARYCFDAARNWALVVALLSDPDARVQYLLVTPYIRRRLLAEGERVGADEALMERVRTATAPHSGSRSHRSHFHVRIYCAEEDRPACIDEPPYHAWYVGTPSPQATAVAHRRARARRARARRARARRARRRRH